MILPAIILSVIILAGLLHFYLRYRSAKRRKDGMDRLLNDMGIMDENGKLPWE